MRVEETARPRYARVLAHGLVTGLPMSPDTYMEAWSLAPLVYS